MSGSFLSKSSVIFNFFSLFILGIAGILYNFLIARYYSAEVLGIFNQALGSYVIVSQFASWGIHISAMKYISEDVSNEARTQHIAQAALLAVAFPAAMFSTLCWLLSGSIGSILGSPKVTVAITWLAPGILFFALNKVFLSLLNGLKRMNTYAVFQSLRYLYLLFGVVACVILQVDDVSLTAVFTFAEMLLFFCLSAYLRQYIFSKFNGVEIKKWLRTHFNFGSKSVFTGALVELNTRVDVLIIGYFLSDKMVGLYSFASTVVEGFMQFLIVLQVILNPNLSALTAQKKLTELRERALRSRNWIYLISFAAVPTIVAVFPLAVKIGTQESFLEAWIPFGILMVGVMLISGYVPFGNILAMSNRPGYQTFQVFAATLLNIILNISLIPKFELVGSAVATVTAMIFAVLLQLFLVKKILSLKLY